MDKKLRLDALKTLLDGVKTKLLLFSGGFGGVVALTFKYFSTASLLIGSFAGSILFAGILINLSKLNKILNEVERLKDAT